MAKPKVNETKWVKLRKSGTNSNELAQTNDNFNTVRQNHPNSYKQSEIETKLDKFKKNWQKEIYDTNNRNIQQNWEILRKHISELSKRVILRPIETRSNKI